MNLPAKIQSRVLYMNDAFLITLTTATFDCDCIILTGERCLLQL